MKWFSFLFKFATICMQNDNEAHAFALSTWKWAINNVQAKNWTKKHFRLKLIYGSESSVQGKKNLSCSWYWASGRNINSVCGCGVECVLHMRSRTHIDPTAKRLCVVVAAVAISAFLVASHIHAYIILAFVSYSRLRSLFNMNIALLF